MSKDVHGSLEHHLDFETEPVTEARFFDMTSTCFARCQLENPIAATMSMPCPRVLTDQSEALLAFTRTQTVALTEEGNEQRRTSQSVLEKKGGSVFSFWDLNLSSISNDDGSYWI